MKNIEKDQPLSIFIDGAIRPEQGISGVAAIVRSTDNQILYWWKKKMGKMTCNEAEYAAAIFACRQLLSLQKGFHLRPIQIFSDSMVMVTQMNGQACVNAPALQRNHALLRSLTTQFKSISFQHISREHNRLADALAFEALGKIEVKTKRLKKKTNQETWDQLNTLWRNK